MAKLTLPDIGTLSNQSSAREAMNENFDLIEAALENTLSRDGTTPNQMEADIDLNSNSIINLADPVADGDAVNKRSVGALVDGYASTIAETLIQGTARTEVFTATASQTAFPLQDTPSGVDAMFVYDNGVAMVPGVDFTLTGDPLQTLEFFVGRTVGHTIVARYVQLAPADSLLRADLATTADDKGTDLVAYSDAFAPTYLKTLSDIINGETVSVMRAINRSKHAEIYAGTNNEDHADSINDLIAEMAAAGHGHVVHERGLIHIGSPISLSSDIIFSGGGTRAIIKPLNAMSAMVNLIGNASTIRDMQLAQDTDLAEIGVKITAPFFSKVENLYMANFPIGVKCDGAQSFWIERNTMIGSDFGIYYNEDGRNSWISRNHVEGGTGIWIAGPTIQAEGVRITDNTLLPNVTSDPNSGYGIVISRGLEFAIHGNIVDNVDKVGLVLAGTGINAVSAVKVSSNWFGVGTANSEGALIYGNVADVVLNHNTFAGADLYGLHIGVAALPTPQRISVLDNTFIVNTGGDVRVEVGVDLDVRGNEFTHATQPYREESNAVTARVAYNKFPVVPAARSTASYYTENVGPSGLNSDNGAYTPTLSNFGNVAAVSGFETAWSRVGDTVTVGGRMDVTPTAAATLTQVNVSLPVASNLSLNGDLGGTCSALGATSVSPGFLSGDPANDRAVLQFYSTGTTLVPVFFSFSYTVK